MQSSKNGNIFQEMELFNPKLKISCFLGESFRVFHQCFFRCFHFCHAFISSDAFIVDCTSLFVRYFAFVLFIFLFLVFVDLREHFFLSDIIYLHSFLFLTRLPWGGGELAAAALGQNIYQWYFVRRVYYSLGYLTL